jgi:ubiquitin-like 1-activating enzyme E1 A
LNPRVEVIVDQQNINEKSAEFFETFSVVCLIHSEYDIIVSRYTCFVLALIAYTFLKSRVDEIRRNIKKPFYAADAFGWFGYIFCDLTEHAYIQYSRI